jgi:hypothetical protein
MRQREKKKRREEKGREVVNQAVKSEFYFKK